MHEANGLSTCQARKLATFNFIPMSSTAIIVDAACDLPASYIAQNNIFVLPFNVITKAGAVIDDGTVHCKLALYASHIKGKSQDFAQTAVLPSHEIESFFFKHIALKFDSAIFISVASSRSEMHKTVRDAWNDMTVNAYSLRRNNGLDGAFDLRIIDSNTLGPGQGLLTYAAVAAIKASKNINKIVEFIEKTRSTIFTYGVPDDLLYAYTRAKSKNENSVTWGKYVLGNALNLKPIVRFYDGDSASVSRGRGVSGAFEKITAHIENKLRNNKIRIDMINVSYSGDLQEFETSSKYLQLKAVAQQCGVNVFLSHMSVTLAVHFGEKAVMIALGALTSDLNE
jgi:DegV family protein with EDD domain